MALKWVELRESHERETALSSCRSMRVHSISLCAPPSLEHYSRVYIGPDPTTYPRYASGSLLERSRFCTAPLIGGHAPQVQHIQRASVIQHVSRTSNRV